MRSHERCDDSPCPCLAELFGLGLVFGCVTLHRDFLDLAVLLQRELFDVHNGGELFYEFTAEKLQLPDTPPVLFQVLYFCLSDGFRGKYDAEPARIEQTKLVLVEKIALPATPATAARKRRGRAEAEPAVVLPPAQARWFYLTALLSVLLIVGLTILFTNL